NFVDGLDGLAAGVVGIGAVAFFLFCYQLTRFNDASRATTSALLSAALGGGCAGFLVHNFHPARLFMGDSGSMLIGLVLSASAGTLTGPFAETDLSPGGGPPPGPPAAPPHAGAAARLAAGRAPGGPGAGRGAKNPGRTVAVRRGQAAP